jgi:cyclopropane-fatty-acyl-phospholipid synthase
MNSIFKRFLGRSIRSGRLEVVDPDGNRHIFGDGSGPPVRIRITTAKAELGLLLNPELKLGEAFTDGELVIEAGSIYGLIELLFENLPTTHPTWTATAFAGMRYATRRIRQFNTPLRAKHNIARHYDLDGRLYALFLDEDMQYSCAYFEEGVESLDEAQLAKKRHLAAKMLLAPGQRVLDIGSGWGGLALYLAEHFDVDVTGITLSDEQFKASNRRAEERGLAARVRFRLRDRSIGSSRSVCSSMSASATTRNSSRPAATSSRSTASCFSIRSGASTGRPTPIRGSRNTSFPAAISRRCRRWCRRSSGSG